MRNVLICSEMGVRFFDGIMGTLKSGSARVIYKCLYIWKFVYM